MMMMIVMTQTSNVKLGGIRILRSNCICSHAFIFALEKSIVMMTMMKVNITMMMVMTMRMNKDLVSFFSCLNAQGPWKAKHW